MDNSVILVDLEFVKSLVVDIDEALNKGDSGNAVALLKEARTKIDGVIQTLQYHGGI